MIFDPFEDLKINKKLGFGCMRLPMKGDQVDEEQFRQMIDAFMEAGFCYFDTAHGYLDGKSETALRACLTSRYPRENYFLADKLTTFYFDRKEEIRPLLEKQLACCGVDCFDFYLMHGQNAAIYEKFKRCHAYETALQLKTEGKIRHFGISFHDTAQVLEQILIEYPQIEFVQIQFNYVDYEDPAVESRKCYEVCRRYGKPVIVMEPVKGGTLSALPEDAAAVFHALGGSSPAGYALRFAAGFEGVRMVLSGMSDLRQVQENISIMKEPHPLDEREQAAVEEVCGILRSKNMIPCTACRYCMAGCPVRISIPDLFACMNAKVLYQDWNSGYYYEDVYTSRGGKASDCIKCGKCEAACPQHLPVRSLLEKVAAAFEQSEGAP